MSYLAALCLCGLACAGAMPRGPGAPPFQPCRDVLVAPSIGGLAIEAEALSGALDDPAEQVAFVSEGGLGAQTYCAVTKVCPILQQATETRPPSPRLA